MKITHLARLCVALLCCYGATAWAGQGRGEARRDERSSAVEENGRGHRRGDGDSYFHRHGYTRLDIPKGHYPPPGECRIWYPGQPPGQQPPPGPCARLRARVPPGAWLITHPEHDEAHVQVAVYDDARPGVIQVVGEFEIATGVFVRVAANWP